MKLQVKQLDTATTNTIAVVLEEYAEYYCHPFSPRVDECQELAVMFRHSIPLLVSEGYDSSVDDVQVLGKQEKGGE